MMPQRAMIAGILVLTATMGSRVAAQLPGFEIVQITNDSFQDSAPAINNCGEIAFNKRLGNPVTAMEIFLYDNGKTTQITDDEIQDSHSDINDSGTIVWPHVDEVSGVKQILRHADGKTTVLAEEIDVFFNGVAMNILGHVIWNRNNDENCGHGRELLLFDGETIQQVTDNDFSNQQAQLNDNDDIAWTRYDFCPGMFVWTSDIMLRPSGGRTILLPSIIGTQHQFTALNNLGQVAWRSGIPDSGGDKMIHFWEDGVTTILTDWGTGPKLTNI